MPVKYLSAPAVAAMFGCDVQKVRRWISDGLLEAVNAADIGAGRPLWKIHPDAVTRFAELRSGTSVKSKKSS